MPTLIVLPESCIARNLKKFGFKTFDTQIVSHVNAIILNLVVKTLKVNLKAQKGGRIVLPMEYFGVSTNEYSNAQGPYTDMSISSSYIRPPMNASFGQSGGAKSGTFSVTLKDMSTFLTEAAGGRPVNSRKEVIAVLVTKVSEALTLFFTSLQKQAKGATHLDVATFETKLKVKTFKLKI